MSSRLHLIISLLLCGLIVALFLLFFEYYQEEQDLGWSKEAKRNRYLAAQMFHQQRGYPATSSDSLIKLGELADYQTLLIASSSQIISETRLQQIIQWIDDGGHLIVAAQSESDNENSRLFDYLELRVEESDYDKKPFSQGSALEFNSENGQGNHKDSLEKPSEELRRINEELIRQAEWEENNKNLDQQQKVANFESQVTDAELSYLMFDGIEGRLKIHFNPSLALQHPAFNDQYWQSENYQVLYWSGSDYGTHFLQLEHGNGLVSIISSPNVFQSDEIIYFDHSYLWQILSSHDKLGISYGITMPSLWDMLRSFLPELLIAFAAFIVAWVWHKRLRFGPVFNEVVNVRRSSAEHIAASAAYIWRGNWQQRLLQPLRDDIQQRAEKRLSGYEYAGVTEKLQLLADSAKVELARVQHAMNHQEKLSEEQFYRSVRLLQRIRESL